MRIAIVIPCYNEALRLKSDVLADFAMNHVDWRLIFVNDGSSDQTPAVLNRLAEEYSNVEVLSLAINEGKAEAVRQGIMRALDDGAEIVGFMDADLSTPLTEIEAMVELADSGRWQMVFASRIRTLNTHIRRYFWRHALGRVFASIAAWLIGLPVYDTQCGAKFFRADLARLLFEQRFASRWFFDLEIFIRAKKELGLETSNQALEYLLSEWYDEGASKLRIFDFLSVPWELAKIYRKYQKLK
ncbi:MAG: glycosyltransferase [Candidatus Falkowbacteria bacterium]